MEIRSRPIKKNSCILVGFEINCCTLVSITVCNGNFVGRVILSPTHIRTHLHIHIHTQAHIVAEKIVAFYCKQEETKRTGRIFVRHFCWLSRCGSYCRSLSLSHSLRSLTHSGVPHTATAGNGQQAVAPTSLTRKDRTNLPRGA